jgi:acylphosphatase
VETRAVEVTVSGVVQGVYFRAHCATEADRLGVRGWVRNEYDGSVCAHFEGSPDAVEAMIAWCHRGSPRARVDRVGVTDSEPQGMKGFGAG